MLVGGFSAQSAHRSFACSMTVSVAFCCLSGGYLYFFSVIFTSNLSLAWTLSLIVQSMVTFLRMVSTISLAIVFSSW